MPFALRQLTLVPFGGLCNRLRAIASGRRLCRLVGASHAMVWDWGNFDDFFKPMTDTRILDRPPGTGTMVRHGPSHEESDRAIDVMLPDIELHTVYAFWGSHEERIWPRDVRPYLPILQDHLAAIVAEFRDRHLRDAVGFHIRRTDNVKSTDWSPDQLFIDKGREIVAQGRRIFLSTDNQHTERQFRRIFGRNLITYPKRQRLLRRWPRAFDQTAMEDDLIDLFLLASSEYVVGSYWSSFSGIAVLLNGSSQSFILRRQS